MGEVAISFPDGTLSLLEKLEASAHKVALKRGKIKEHEEKVLKMKMKIQELRRQRDELKTKLNVCQSQLIAGKDAMKSSLQVSEATETSQQAILKGKIENAKGLLELFRLTGLSGKLTEQGVSLCINTAFEGTYLDSYYLDIRMQQPLQIQHHSVPAFIPLEQIAHEHLQKDIKRFLAVLSDHLNAYARRKFQVDQLQKMHQPPWLRWQQFIWLCSMRSLFKKPLFLSQPQLKISVNRLHWHHLSTLHLVAEEFPRRPLRCKFH
ncbi:centromere protein O isoform 3-T4 [Liasis olivaceus]